MHIALISLSSRTFSKSHEVGFTNGVEYGRTHIIVLKIYYISFHVGLKLTIFIFTIND